MAQKALIVIDVQNDFCPGGELAVENGDEIVPLVNHLIASHDHVVLTQDWHPAGHSSFASRHEGKAPFETIEVSYGPQTLWPDHCVQGSTGSEFHPELEWTRAEMVKISAGVRAHSIAALKYSRLVGRSRKLALVTAASMLPSTRCMDIWSSTEGVGAACKLPSGCWK